MFCTGNCFKGKKTCGLLYDVMMENVQTGKIESVKKCVFHHLLESSTRKETGQVRLQASIEEARNQKANDDARMGDTVATGFLGLIHTMNENPEAKEKLKTLKHSSSNVDLLEGS